MTLEILGESCSVSPRSQTEAGQQGRRLIHDELACALTSCALNRGTVFPGICHTEDVSLLIGERADTQLEMSRAWLC